MLSLRRQQGWWYHHHAPSGVVYLATLVALSLFVISSRYSFSPYLYRSLRRDESASRADESIVVGMEVSSAQAHSSAIPEVADEFLLHPRKDIVLSNHPDDEQDLEIAFLMSFPNSGTSYTTKLIRHVSLTHTASNYGHENHPTTGESLPVFVDQPTGPFWVNPQLHPEYSNPAKYVLTKTHCGLRCIQCPPQNYVETTFSFRRRCLSGRKMRLVNGARVYDAVEYPDRRVTKAVHLIRDPFDNVVSRFHLERHEGKTAVDIPSSREGFRLFCQRMNDAHVIQEQSAHFLDVDVLQLLQDVPCRADLIRYIEWHNLAFATSHDMNLETHVLHYDWYTTRFNDTVAELLEFLQLPPRSDPPLFIAGKVYRNDYFTEHEQDSVYRAFRLLATKTTWKHLGSYFDAK